MSWLAVLRLVLSIADTIADIVRERNLMDAGAKSEIANQLTEIARRVDATEEIRASVAALSDEEIDEELGRTDPL